MITVVCSLPRSGSSLMMQMLEAVGMACAGEYPAFEPDEIAAPTAEFVSRFEGGAFKLLNPHLVPLPPGLPYRFIFLTRSRRQQARSTAKMLRVAQGISEELSPSGESMIRIEESLAEDREAALSALGQHFCPMLRIRFEDLIARPESTVWQIKEFLQLSESSQVAMRSVIFPRSVECYDGFLEALLLEVRKPSVTAEAEAEEEEPLPPYDPAKCTCSHPPHNPPCHYCESGNYDPASV